jgi:FtsP/CotA-like multicopper oxidase with cupredoxin domain
VFLPILATIVVLAPLAYLWQASLVPKRYSVMSMGELDYGGGPRTGGHGGHGSAHGEPGAGTRSVDQLIADPARPADQRVDLVAEQRTFVVGGRTIPGFTVNGASPGPLITLQQGQLVEVHLKNQSVSYGVTLHWHGLDVPNAMDGVAGVTQNEVPVGGEFVYRFVADQVGTFWYHAHQTSDAEVAGGLFGALVVRPTKALPESVDVVALSHTYDSVRSLNGVAEDLRVPAKPGQRVRVRVINTDNGAIQAWATVPYRLLATDGDEVHEPTPVTDQSTTVTAGGRADIGVTMPANGTPVRVQVSRGTAVILGAGDLPVPPQPTQILDLMTYGTPAPLSFDPAQATRKFTYSIGHRPGFVRGRPGLWWSVNGHLYPDVPMFVVSAGDVVTMRIDNHSGDAHPMHLHGHHAVVIARNGVPASGSPWWVDSLNVLDGETMDIAFVADNPGIWMDHCHNLTHAAQGMVAHLMYTGVTTPYAIGGSEKNAPE